MQHKGSNRDSSRLRQHIRTFCASTLHFLYASASVSASAGVSHRRAYCMCLCLVPVPCACVLCFALKSHVSVLPFSRLLHLTLPNEAHLTLVSPLGLDLFSYFRMPLHNSAHETSSCTPFAPSSFGLDRKSRKKGTRQDRPTTQVAACTGGGRRTMHMCVHLTCTADKKRDSTEENRSGEHV